MQITILQQFDFIVDVSTFFFLNIRICYELRRQEDGGKVITSEEVTTFLSTSFEETILPAVLVCVA